MYHAIVACRVHCLKNQKQSITIIRIMNIRQFAELLNMTGKRL